ncbi:relaxase/mobilization nuclease domain-containing protein [Marivita sp. GX14005]|uniref:relaxase/mobilization nuclease domain-containing protein n=1 Tax=Marivita sp. GX14005 TaxID=2942276 RepID=UPI00201A21B3|nr:relaxase/mobilization nuclease domain-containing protein [Marivita sp. GX14005]MCL3881012.1 relaxase/mobilization nuclease domain-containing protein [Marivita sp. GX14005]
MGTVHFKIPEEMLRVGAMLAREDDISLGQLLRNLLAKEISRRKNARPPNRADELLIAPLRARLAPEFANATGWESLRHRLKECGYELRPAGGGLALFTYPEGSRVCKGSELGFSYSKLVERFEAGFPGHTHTWIAERFAQRREPMRAPDPRFFDS